MESEVVKGSDDSQPTMVCDLTAIGIDERDAHIAVARQLFGRVDRIQELPNGYEFFLPSDPSMLAKAAEFISRERICCPFLTMTLEVGPRTGPLSLRITSNAKGIKQFVRSELESFKQLESSRVRD